MEWLGQYHPFIAHFSIGLLPAGVLIFAIYYWSKHEWFLYTALTMFVIATVAGFISTYSGDIAHEVVERIPGVRNAIHEHEDWADIVKWSNIILTVLAFVYVQFKDKEWLRYNQDFAHWLVVVVGLWAVIAVVQTGRKGGDLVYDYMVAGGARGNSEESINRQANAYYYNKLQFLKTAKNGQADIPKIISMFREIEANYPENLDYKIMYARFLFQELNSAQEAIDKVNETIAKITDLKSPVHYNALDTKYLAYVSLNDKAKQEEVLAEVKKYFPNSRLAK